jgi:DnaJ-domain-containing protein 1
VLRGQVRDALADGRLDPTEQRSLERLQEELGLSSEELDRLVTLQSQFMKRHRFCPHCGESLAEDA